MSCKTKFSVKQKRIQNKLIVKLIVMIILDYWNSILYEITRESEIFPSIKIIRNKLYKIIN